LITNLVLACNYWLDNKPFYGCSLIVAWPLNEVRLEVTLLWWKPPYFSYVNDAVLMLISSNSHKKSNEVFNKTGSPPGSFSFKGQAINEAHNSKMVFCYSVYYIKDCNFKGEVKVKINPTIFLSDYFRNIIYLWYKKKSKSPDRHWISLKCVLVFQFEHPHI